MKPEVRIQNAIRALEDKETQWEALIEALNELKSIAFSNPATFNSNMATVTTLVVKNCNNIRSRISGAAIETLKELFRLLKKKMMPHLNESVAALIAEAGKENVFIREKCERCLAEIVETGLGTNQKLFASLAPHGKSKNQTARILAAQFVHMAVGKIGADKCLAGNATTKSVIRLALFFFALESSFGKISVKF